MDAVGLRVNIEGRCFPHGNLRMGARSVGIVQCATYDNEENFKSHQMRTILLACLLRFATETRNYNI